MFDTSGCNTGKDSGNLVKQPGEIYVFGDEWRAQTTGFTGDKGEIK